MIKKRPHCEINPISKTNLPVTHGEYEQSECIEPSLSNNEKNPSIRSKLLLRMCANLDFHNLIIKYTRYFIFLFSLSTLSLVTAEETKPQPKKAGAHAITNGREKWRRLGDHITTYCKMKYYSYTYQLPVLYTTFEYSEQFQLHYEETILNDELQKKFKKIVLINTEKDLTDNLSSEDPILFVTIFLSPTPSLFSFSRQPDNQAFEQEIKAMLTPIKPILPLPKPANVTTVAVHVRKGGGYDQPLGSAQEYTVQEPLVKEKEVYLYKNNPYNCCIDMWPMGYEPGPGYITRTTEFIYKKTNFSDYIWPIKFPADQYYIDQIKRLSEMLPGQDLLVYLFTDDKNPEEIVKRYKQALKKENIIFSYRKFGNNHDQNVLEDLFLLAQCDCIISASSSFASIAQLLGNHAVIMFPTHAITMPDKIIIDKVGVLQIKISSEAEQKKLIYKEIETISVQR